MGGSGIIRLTQHIEQQPSRVWESLTDPSLVREWWASGDVRPVVGHHFTLDMGAFGQQACEVLRVEPERVLVYSFGTDTLDTTITWLLEPSDGGTDLILEHAGFDLESEMGRRALQGMQAGWPSILSRIGPVLDGSVTT